MPGNDDELLIDLKAEVAAELAVAHTDDPDAAYEVPPDQWLFSPTALEREEVGLRNILGAIEALQAGPQPPGD